jgi:hypothetical protein
MLQERRFDSRSENVCERPHGEVQRRSSSKRRKRSEDLTSKVAADAIADLDERHEHGDEDDVRSSLVPACRTSTRSACGYEANGEGDQGDDGKSDGGPCRPGRASLATSQPSCGARGLSLSQAELTSEATANRESQAAHGGSMSACAAWRA